METTYKETINNLKPEREKAKRKSRYLLLLKLISFTATALCIYGACTLPNLLLYLIPGLLCAGIYLFALLRDARCMQYIDQLDALLQACHNELSYLKGDFSPFDNGARYIDPHHAFTYDLDVFGPDSLFQRINRTRTQGGSDRLAEKLSTLETRVDVIRENQQAIKELSEHNIWRLRFMAGEKVDSRFGALCRQFAGKTSGSSSAVRSFLLFLFPILTLSALAGYALDRLPGIWFYALFFLQLFVCMASGKKIRNTLLATEHLHQEFKGYLEILREIKGGTFQTRPLRHLQHLLFYKEGNSAQAFKELSRLQNLFDQRSNALMYILLNGLFLHDLRLIRRFDHWIRQYAPHVETWIDCVSEMDALVSLATYAANNPRNTQPQLLTETEAPVILAKDTFHPFLAHKQAVPNSFRLDRKSIAIVTGANMAGKSTFLRTIGVNYLLATTGTTVCARKFACSIVSLFSSMRTADNLSHDISYFHAELLRLKQLITHVRSHECSLIILDEILKGTNSKDKLQGSILFLNEISRYNLSALIATHDLELARLEEENGDLYQNYCFEIELSHDIRYSYKIQKGVAQNLNASFLLQEILTSCSAPAEPEKQTETAQPI